MYGIRTLLRAGVENISDRQRARLTAAFTAHEAHVEVELAWQVAQDVRALFHAPTPAVGRAAARRLLEILPTSPIREVKRLGRTLKRWSGPLLAYFDTGGASNGGTPGHQRSDRAPPPRRARLPQPPQLPTAHAPHRRRTHPMTHAQLRRAGLTGTGPL